jgi:ABC-type spermidine/putrescine transport system permease subunit I
MSNEESSRAKITVLMLILPTLLYLVLFWLVPVANIFWMSFTLGDTYLQGKPNYVGINNYSIIFTDFLETIRNTIVYPLVAALIDLVLGIPLAYLLVRKKVGFTSILRAALIFPYFGDIYVSYGLWNMFLPGGIFDPIYSITGLNYKNFLYNPNAVIFGFAVFTLPFMVLYSSSAISQIDMSYEEVSMTLGYTPVETFLKVIVPLATPGIIAGFIACFGWNLGGYLIPLLLGGVDSSNVMTVKIVELSLRIHNYGLAASLAIILLVITLISSYLTFKITKALE